MDEVEAEVEAVKRGDEDAVEVEVGAVVEAEVEEPSLGTRLKGRWKLKGRSKKDELVVVVLLQVVDVVEMDGGSAAS